MSPALVAPGILYRARVPAIVLRNGLARKSAHLERHRSHSDHQRFRAPLEMK